MKYSISLVFFVGCIEPVTVEQEREAAVIEVGQTREIELRTLRLDVEDYRQTLTLEDLQRLPRATLEELWLLDLEMQPLVTNTLLFRREANPAELGSQAASTCRLCSR